MCIIVSGITQTAEVWVQVTDYCPPTINYPCWQVLTQPQSMCKYVILVLLVESLKIGQNMYTKTTSTIRPPHYSRNVKFFLQI